MDYSTHDKIDVSEYFFLWTILQMREVGLMREGKIDEKHKIVKSSSNGLFYT